MFKNYYKILEISENASPEIVKKAYTTLAKKYHPDLQEGTLKQEYEEKLKLINEAYEVLSNEEKKKEYDLLLLQDTIGKEKMTEDLINENINLKKELNRIKNYNRTNSVYNYNIQDNLNTNCNSNQNIDNNYESQVHFNEELQKAREKAYHDAYIQDLKNRGYKIKYKKTLKETLISFLLILIILFVLILICQIPFIKNILLNLYEENAVIKILVDIIASLFQLK